MFVRALQNADEGEGGGGGEAQAAPSQDELLAQVKALQEQQAAWAKKEEQYLHALAGVDASRPAPAREEPRATEEEDIDPVIAKRIAKAQEGVRSEYAAQFSEVKDQLDQMNFSQWAATIGVSQEEYVETEKKYQGYRSKGVAVVDETGTRRPLTRMDVLDQIIAAKTRGEMMKNAPAKNLEQLRGKLVGQASFPEVGTMDGGSRYVRLDSELDAQPTKERVGKLEKTLKGIEF